jgi:nitrite reductase/ring-hydroxylating ferredoxin subunit
MSAALIDPEDPRFRLGVEKMDAVHRAFIALTHALADADQAAFLTLFEQLIEHTQAHFDQEEHLRCFMQGIVFDPASGESLSVLCSGQRLEPLRSRESDGHVYIRLAGPTPATFRVLGWQPCFRAAEEPGELLDRSG